MSGAPTKRPPMPQPVVTAYLYGLLGLAIINGIFSPLNILVFGLSPLWYPALFPTDQSIIRFTASLIASTLTLMIAGIPAALYERVFGRDHTDQTSLFIWISGLAVLSIPAVLIALASMR